MKKTYTKPVLTKYGSLQDVYKGESCFGDLPGPC